MPSKKMPRAQIVAGKDGFFRVYEPRSGEWHGPFSADDAADYADELDRRGSRAVKRRDPAPPSTLSLASYVARRHAPAQTQRPPEGVDPTRPYVHASSSGAFYLWSPEEGRYLGPFESEQEARYRLGAMLQAGKRSRLQREEEGQGSLFSQREATAKGGQLRLFGNPRGRCRCGRRGCPCSNPKKVRTQRPRRASVTSMEVQVRQRGPLSGRELHALQVLLEREGRRPSAARLPPGTAYPCSLPEIGRGVGGRDYAGTALACQVPPRGRGVPFVIVGRPVPLSRVRADARKWAKAHGASSAACEAAALAAARGEHVPHALVERCPQAEEAVERYAMQHEGEGPVSFSVEGTPLARPRMLEMAGPPMPRRHVPELPGPPMPRRSRPAMVELPIPLPKARTVNVTVRERDINSRMKGSDTYTLVGLPGSDRLVWADRIEGYEQDDARSNYPQARSIRSSDRHGSDLGSVPLPPGTVVLKLSKHTDGKVTRQATIVPEGLAPTSEERLAPATVSSRKAATGWETVVRSEKYGTRIFKG